MQTAEADRIQSGCFRCHKHSPKRIYCCHRCCVWCRFKQDDRGHYKDVIEEMNQIHAEKVAIDIPSGISSFDGQVLGTAFHADLTVSFACEKLGTVLFPGSDYAGEVIPVEIGIGTKLFEENPEVCYTLEKSDLSKFLPDRKRIPTREVMERF